MEVAAIILAVGGAVLLVFVWPAWRREWRGRFPKERRWECSTIDVRPIADRLEGVRSDFASALHLFPAGRLFREELVCAARRAVTHFAFFRRRRGEPENEAGERPTANQGVEGNHNQD